MGVDVNDIWIAAVAWEHGLTLVDTRWHGQDSRRSRWDGIENRGLVRESCRFSHRLAAAFLAISFRFLAESLSALALPPLAPPKRPRFTAAGFLPSSTDSGAGFSPVEISTISLASSLVSRGLLGRLGHSQNTSTFNGERQAKPAKRNLQTDPLP